MNLDQLVLVSDEKRDSSWENLFFHALSTSKIRFLKDEPQQGPDGWPYMLAETSGEVTEPFHKVLHWLTEKGIGLAVNPQKEYPDYVFTYGMLWHFRQTGLFFGAAGNQPNSGALVLEEGTSVQSGPPSEEYLPKYVRAILKQFFMDQAVLNPRITMLSSDGGKHFDLVVSLDSLGNPPQSEHEGIAEAISWFLPPHYSLALAPEKGLPAFYPL